MILTDRITRLGEWRHGVTGMYDGPSMACEWVECPAPGEPLGVLFVGAHRKHGLAKARDPVGLEQAIGAMPKGSAKWMREYQLAYSHNGDSPAVPLAVITHRLEIARLVGDTFVCGVGGAMLGGFDWWGESARRAGIERARAAAWNGTGGACWYCGAELCLDNPMNERYLCLGHSLESGDFDTTALAVAACRSCRHAAHNFSLSGYRRHVAGLYCERSARFPLTPGERASVVSTYRFWGERPRPWDWTPRPYPPADTEKGNHE